MSRAPGEKGAADSFACLLAYASSPRHRLFPSPRANDIQSLKLALTPAQTCSISPYLLRAHFLSSLRLRLRVKRRPSTLSRIYECVPVRALVRSNVPEQSRPVLQVSQKKVRTVEKDASSATHAMRNKQGERVI